MHDKTPAERRQDQLLYCVLFAFLSAGPPPSR